MRRATWHRCVARRGARSPDPVRVAAMFHERRACEAQRADLATHDAFTCCLTASAITVLFFDLDRFKYINDTL